MSDISGDRNWSRFIGSVALAAVIFLAIGPLVGTVVFLLAYGVFVGEIERGLGALAMMALYFPMFLLSYALAWKAALAAGVVVAVAAAFVRDWRMLFVLAVVAGGMASLILVSPVVAPDGPRMVAGALALAGAVAAVVCAFACARIWRSNWPAIPVLSAKAARGEST